jgi:hypothetical protein
MRWHVKLILAGALLITSAPVAAFRADAQVSELAGSVSTGMIIEQLADKLNGLIERAEQAGDFLAMRAGQEARYVLDAFRTNEHYASRNSL